MATELERLDVVLSADNKGLIRGLDQAKRDVNTFGRDGTRALSNFARVGVGAAVAGIGALSVAVAGSTVAAATMAISWESAFAGVRKTVDATETEFAALDKGLREMAKRKPIKAEDLAGIAEAAGQLGIQKENILEFTDVIADLGEATNLTGEQGATELARLANITRMSQTDFDRLGSTIVALGNNMATTEAEISAMSLRIAGAGTQVGLSEDQILSWAAAMSSLGIEAELGGSAISRVFLEMKSAVVGQTDDLKTWAEVAGQSVDEFSELFEKDASAATLEFVEGLNKLNEQGEDVTPIIEDLGLEGIRLMDVLGRLASGQETVNEALEVGGEAWEENTALTEEAEKRYETAAAKLGIMWNNIRDVGIELGGWTLGPIVGMSESLVAAAENASAFLESLKKVSGWEGADLTEKLGIAWEELNGQLEEWFYAAEYPVRIIPTFGMGSPTGGSWRDVTSTELPMGVMQAEIRFVEGQDTGADQIAQWGIDIGRAIGGTVEALFGAMSDDDGSVLGDMAHTFVDSVKTGLEETDWSKLAQTIQQAIVQAALGIEADSEKISEIEKSYEGQRPGSAGSTLESLGSFFPALNEKLNSAYDALDGWLDELFGIDEAQAAEIQSGIIDAVTIDSAQAQLVGAQFASDFREGIGLWTEQIAAMFSGIRPDPTAAGVYFADGFLIQNVRMVPTLIDIFESQKPNGLAPGVSFADGFLISNVRMVPTLIDIFENQRPSGGGGGSYYGSTFVSAAQAELNKWSPSVPLPTIGGIAQRGGSGFGEDMLAELFQGGGMADVGGLTGYTGGMAQTIAGMFPISLGSGFRPGATVRNTGRRSLHASGRGTDWFGNYGMLRQAFQFLASNAGRFGIQELLHDDLAWSLGAPYVHKNTNAQSVADHRDHLHAGFRFHEGGEVPVLAKVGERFITSEQNEWLTNFTRTIQAQTEVLRRAVVADTPLGERGAEFVDRVTEMFDQRLGDVGSYSSRESARFGMLESLGAMPATLEPVLERLVSLADEAATEAFAQLEWAKANRDRLAPDEFNEVAETYFELAEAAKEARDELVEFAIGVQETAIDDALSFVGREEARLGWQEASGAPHSGMVDTAWGIANYSQRAADEAGDLLAWAKDNRAQLSDQDFNEIAENYFQLSEAAGEAADDLAELTFRPVFDFLDGVEQNIDVQRDALRLDRELNDLRSTERDLRQLQAQGYYTAADIARMRDLGYDIGYTREDMALDRQQDIVSRIDADIKVRVESDGPLTDSQVQQIVDGVTAELVGAGYSTEVSIG